MTETIWISDVDRQATYIIHEPSSLGVFSVLCELLFTLLVSVCIRRPRPPAGYRPVSVDCHLCAVGLGRRSCAVRVC